MTFKLNLCIKFKEKYIIMKEKKKIIATTLNDALLSDVEKYANERGLTLSSVLRIAVIEFFNDLKSDNLGQKKTD